MTPLNQTCRCCNLEKLLTDFAADNRTKNGYSTRCKKCKVVYDRNWRDENRQGVRAAQARYYAKPENKKRKDAYRKKWTIEHTARYRELMREAAKRKRLYVRMQIMVAYGGDPPECACCGESHIEFLSIDHINNDGAAHRRELRKGKQMSFYQWLYRNKFPKGFQVLCHNCNSAKAFYGYCPHQKTVEYGEGIPSVPVGRPRIES